MTDERKSILTRILTGLDRVKDDQLPFLQGYVAAVADLGLAKDERPGEPEPADDGTPSEADDLPFC